MFENFDRNTQHLLAVVGIWIIVVLCAVFSVFSRPFSSREKKFWVLFIVCVPVLGLLTYLPFSIENPKNIRDWFAGLFPSRKE